MSRVFIVDDSKIQLLILDKVLTREGYEVHTFTNGFEMMSEVEKQKPELIISDVEMPAINGFELMKKLHQQLSDHPIPFFFISSHDDDKTIRKAKNNGAKLFLKKPLNTRFFIQAIQRYLPRPLIR